MITEIYIVSESFKYNIHVAEELVGAKIEQLASDCDIFKTNGDILYVNKEVYYIEIFQGQSICDEIYGDKNKRKLSRDQQSALRKIIEYNQTTHETTSTIIQQLDNHNQDAVRGLLCFYGMNCTQSLFVIYSIESWLKFHRYFLGKYPISETEFYEGCNKYFPKIFFHSNVKKSLSTLNPSLSVVSMEIIKNLSALNDEFEKYYVSNNRPRTLAEFSSATGLDASPEGNAARKKDFTFKFSYKSADITIYENVCCEPHLKLSGACIVGSTHYYFNRIYFHEGKNYISEGKILVGHIGEHL